MDAQAPPAEPRFLQPGVVRILTILAVLLLLCGVPYLHPALLEYRPWVPGETLPFHQLLGLVGLDDPAGAAGPDASGAGRPELQAALLAALPASPVAVGGTGPRAPHVTAPAPTAPAAGATRPLPPPVAPAEYEGLTQALEHPPGRGLDPLHTRLAEAELKQPGAIARLLVYGSSTNGTDWITSSLRRRLQLRFGDAGKGFVPIAPAWPTQDHMDIRWTRQGDPWDAQPVINRARKDGRYGLAGVISINQGLSVVQYGTVEKGPVGGAVSRFELWYLARPWGGTVELTVDRNPATRITTLAEQPEDRVFTMDLPDGPHRFQLRVIANKAALYGAVLERSGPGVVVDSAMLIGAQTNRLLHYDATHWADQLARRRSDLVALMLGDNEIEADPHPKLPTFKAELAQVLQRVRAGRPNGACLVLSATDHGRRQRGRVISEPFVQELVAAQREVALAEGCSFFNLFAAMGGEGSMGRWFAAKPRLGWGDFIHFTPEGSDLLGALIYKALLADYAQWLEQQRRGG